jgi:transcriptional regulator with XRE-family HTH domain
MAKEQRSPEALALVYLRNARGWTQKQLTAALGLTDDKKLGRYENGDPPLSRETLETILAPLRFPSEAVDALLFAHRLIFPPSELSDEEAGSPVPVTPEERERIARTAMAGGWSVAEAVRAELTRQKRDQKWEAASREAEELFQRLLQIPADERLAIVDAFPDLNTGPLAVRLCEASLRAAADKAADALEMAALSLAVAERMPAGTAGERWSLRLQGYCWAHLANARRVANDFDGAHGAFTRALALRRAGEPADPGRLPEWRFLSLEASLRREQRRFPEALELLDQALALCAGDPAAQARCLLKKENVYEVMGDLVSTLAVLTEAAPFVEASGDPHLLLALRFKTANNLFHLQRFEEAGRLLPEVGELALQQGAELDVASPGWGHG